MAGKKISPRLNNYSLIISGFILATILVISSVYFFLKKDISIIIFQAILFLYILCVFIVVLRLLFLRYVKDFAKKIGFEVVTPFYIQPKLEGYYKNNWFQIHYVSKETGKSPSLLRTYIKLQYKKIKHFDTEELDKYDDKPYKEYQLLTVKHIIREDKNYLLLKSKWFIFDERKIHELMDLLLKISREAEVRKKN
jgi:hypothetical protein